MMSSSSNSKRIILKSSDGESFEVEEAVALESQMLKYMIVDNDDTIITIPVHEVTSKILGMVIEFCKRHVEEAAKSAGDFPGSLKAFDANFVKVDKETLFDLIVAANYLNIKTLLDLTCDTVGNMIRGKSPEEIRKFFNTRNAFTPEKEEEEEEVRT